MKVFGVILVVITFVSILSDVVSDEKVVSKKDLISWKMIAMLYLILDIVKR